METFSTLLDLCAGNSPVTGEFPAQRPVMRSFDVFFDLHLNKRLSNQSWGWWFDMLSCPLWRHRNGFFSDETVLQKFPVQQILVGSGMEYMYYPFICLKEAFYWCFKYIFLFWKHQNICVKLYFQNGYITQHYWLKQTHFWPKMHDACNLNSVSIPSPSCVAVHVKV